MGRVARAAESNNRTICRTKSFKRGNGCQIFKIDNRTTRLECTAFHKALLLFRVDGQVVGLSRHLMHPLMEAATVALEYLHIRHHLYLPRLAATSVRLYHHHTTLSSALIFKLYQFPLQPIHHLPMSSCIHPSLHQIPQSLQAKCCPQSLQVSLYRGGFL